MLARKKSSKIGKNLPQDWAESLARLLNETFKTECEANGRYFDVYAQIYPEELLLVVSYLSEKDEYLAPITLFLSAEADQINDPEKFKVTHKNLVEVVGLFFDEIFSDNEWANFEPTWQEVKHKHETYFFKISRENINATLEANKLLGEDFEDVEFEEDQEMNIVETDSDYEQ